MLRGILQLTLGATTARLAGIVSMPIITRLFDPAVVGQYAVFVSAIAIIAPLLTWRYVIAIPLPRGNQVAFELAKISLLLCAVNSLALMALSVPAIEIINQTLEAEIDYGFAFLVVSISMLMAAVEVLQMWSARTRDYLIITKSQIGQALISESTKLAIAVQSASLTGLILGHILGIMGAISILTIPQ